jgi:hypothetical protein
MAIETTSIVFKTKTILIMINGILPMKRTSSHHTILLLLCSLVISFQVIAANKTKTTGAGSKFDLAKANANQIQRIKQGFSMKVWMSNRAALGIAAWDINSNPPDGVGLEYPQNSRIEHLFGGGPWIGAIVDTSERGSSRKIKTVTCGYGDASILYEFFGNPDGSDSFYVTDVDHPNGRNVRGYDDDGDGKIDEDELDGIDNDGDGLIDEDYGALSEKDIYVAYTDTFHIPMIIGHIPLGIKVWQRSFAWRSRVKEPIIPFEYNFINVGKKILDSVYVGWFADVDVGPTTISGYYQNNFGAYIRDLRTVYVHNPVDKPSTPIGITVLGTPKRLDSLKFSFQWYTGGQGPGTDVARYDLMASGVIEPDQYPALSDVRIMFAFGPFATMKPGDTLKIVSAFVSGEGVFEGLNNLHDNATRALELYNRGFTTRPVPPSPPLHITKGNDKVILNWQWQSGDSSCDPLQTWDDSDKFVNALPDTHWRKRNPELRCRPYLTHGNSGGRIFEGFRVWRSESPSPEPDPKSFALLKQFDVNDDLGIEQGTGLEFSLIDSHLVRGRHYWYAVTSFSVPGLTLVQIPDSNGIVRIDTLISPSVESAYGENVQLVILPFEPSSKVGEVRVVPNPYRTNADYTFEGGGFEGLGHFWTENKRVIWFIHLPPKCTIRIFSLAGDLVATLEHNDASRTTPDLPVGQQEWNLLSESGRTIASGVYIYTVESEFGRQIDKFVVIR